MDSDTRWPELLNCERTFELPKIGCFLLELLNYIKVDCRFCFIRQLHTQVFNMGDRIINLYYP